MRCRLRKFRYSAFGVATEVATVTLLDEQDGEVNAKWGSWLSTRRVEPPWRKPHGEAAIGEGE